MSKTLKLFIAKGDPGHKHSAGCYFELVMRDKKNDTTP